MGNPIHHEIPQKIENGNVHKSWNFGRRTRYRVFLLLRFMVWFDFCHLEMLETKCAAGTLKLKSPLKKRIKSLTSGKRTRGASKSFSHSWLGLFPVITKKEQYAVVDGKGLGRRGRQRLKDDFPPLSSLSGENQGLKSSSLFAAFARTSWSR